MLVMAYLNPIQFRGPNPKGKYENLGLSFSFSGRKLYGSNFSAFSPQISFLLCRVCMTIAIVQFGVMMPESGNNILIRIQY